MPQDGVAVAVATTVATRVEVAAAPRETDVTVRVVAVRFPGPGDSCDPRKSHDVRLGALQKPAGTVPFSFALPLSESSCSEDGRVVGNAVYAFASRKLRNKKRRKSGCARAIAHAADTYSDLREVKKARSGTAPERELYDRSLYDARCQTVLTTMQFIQNAHR